MCRSCFCEVYEVGQSQLDDLSAVVSLDHVVVPEHGRTGTRDASTLERERGVKASIEAYAAANTMPSPGAARESSAKVRLPPCTTITGMHEHYCGNFGQVALAAPKHAQPVSYRVFARIFSEMPHIAIMTPRSDLCDTCVAFRNKMAVVSSPEGIDALLVAWDEHMKLARCARDMYHDDVSAACAGASSAAAQPSRSPIRVHRQLVLSFDFAEAVRLPHAFDQAGQRYFATGRKVDIWAIVNEAYRSVRLYLIDEEDSCGKGPNVVASMVKHTLNDLAISQSLPETVVLYFDNTVSQAKPDRAPVAVPSQPCSEVCH